MGIFKKIIFLAVLVLIAYFVAQQFGILGGASAIQNIDSKYGIGEGKLVPGTSEELENYERELKGVNASGKEKALKELKLELVGMQKEMILLQENASRINFNEPNCAVSGAIVLTRKNAENALSHLENAVAKKEAVRGLEGFSYINGTIFSETLQSVKASLSNQINVLKTVCA
ncbi:MAG TPA: hypothetical protein VFF13_04075 [archaeon]|nr:hypothetical protein [archaeon]